MDRWYNEHRLTFALDKVTDEGELEAVLEGLDMVMADPYGPLTTEMRGTRDHVDRRIAILPRGWVLVFTPYPNGVFPHREPGLLVRELRCQFPESR